MHIELQKLKVVPSLSQETTAYTAIILVDGTPAFHAENHGHGSADAFYPVLGYTGANLAAVNDWLKANEPPEGPFEPDSSKRAAFDRGSSCDLEIYVMRWIAKADATRNLTRLLKTNVVAIGAGGDLFKFKAKPTPDAIAGLKARNPGDTIVNEAGADVFARALAAYAGIGQEADEVHARQREGRLTHADACWLRGENRRASKTCPDLARHLDDFIAEDEARFARFQAEREAQRQATP